jgi:hypothetical protein
MPPQNRYAAFPRGVFLVCERIGRLACTHKLPLKVLHPAFAQELRFKIEHARDHFPVALNRFDRVLVSLFFVTELPIERFQRLAVAFVFIATKPVDQVQPTLQIRRNVPQTRHANTRTRAWLASFAPVRRAQSSYA